MSTASASFNEHDNPETELTPTIDPQTTINQEYGETVACTVVPGDLVVGLHDGNGNAAATEANAFMNSRRKNQANWEDTITPGLLPGEDELRPKVGRPLGEDVSVSAPIDSFHMFFEVDSVIALLIKKLTSMLLSSKAMTLFLGAWQDGMTSRRRSCMTFWRC